VQPPPNYNDSEARRMSVGAFDLLKNCQLFDSIDSALADVSLAVGTTSARRRGVAPLPLPYAAPRCLAVAANNRVAILFGDERNGLSSQELERCHYTVTIPADPTFPTLNIAHAVAICAYELTRARTAGAPSADELTVGSQDDELFWQIDVLLDKVGFSRRYNRSLILAEIRQFYQRAHPTRRELALLKGALHRINQNLP
jgi:tRNA (cytidine32/uridine32-2'-O)-methyltransferase